MGRTSGVCPDKCVSCIRVNGGAAGDQGAGVPNALRVPLTLCWRMTASMSRMMVSWSSGLAPSSSRKRSRRRNQCSGRAGGRAWILAGGQAGPERPAAATGKTAPQSAPRAPERARGAGTTDSVHHTACQKCPGSGDILPERSPSDGVLPDVQCSAGPPPASRSFGSGGDNLPRAASGARNDLHNDSLSGGCGRPFRPGLATG